MWTSLELENYRGFSHYRLKNLARVNLLVGKNNCGKTSILEAVYLLSSGGDLSVFTRLASQRGELAPSPEDRGGMREIGRPVVSHFFHGHDFREGSALVLRSNGGLGRLAARVRAASETEVTEVQIPFDVERVQFHALLALDVEQGQAERGATRTHLVSEDGRIVRPARQAFSSPTTPRTNLEAVRPVEFITPSSLEPHSMTARWNKVVTEAREQEVVEAMQLLEPNLTNIFFLSDASFLPFGGAVGILVELENPRRREPLGSHGDGMRRMLALALALIQAESGVLLVDEIDTGLHYSVMGQMWRLVTEAARRADVQVFATTHSQDCVRGLAWLCENHPELRGDVSLQKVHSDLEESVDLDAEGIMLAVDQGMEVR